MNAISIAGLTVIVLGIISAIIRAYLWRTRTRRESAEKSKRNPWAFHDRPCGYDTQPREFDAALPVDSKTLQDCINYGGFAKGGIIGSPVPLGESHPPPNVLPDPKRSTPVCGWSVGDRVTVKEKDRGEGTVRAIRWEEATLSWEFFVEFALKTEWIEYEQIAHGVTRDGTAFVPLPKGMQIPVTFKGEKRG